MTYEEWLSERTERIPGKMGGRRCFKGTRMRVWMVGCWTDLSAESIQWMFPWLSVNDIMMARLFKTLHTRKVKRCK